MFPYPTIGRFTSPTPLTHRSKRRIWQTPQRESQIRQRSDIDRKRQWGALRMGLHSRSRREVVRVLHPNVCHYLG